MVLCCCCGLFVVFCSGSCWCLLLFVVVVVVRVGGVVVGLDHPARTPLRRTAPPLDRPKFRSFFSPPGLHTTALRSPNVHISGPRRFKHHQNSTEGLPRERQKDRKWEREKEKQSAKIWSPLPFGPHPSKPHPSKPHPSGPALRGPTMTHTRSKNGWAKIELAQIGFSPNWQGQNHDGQKWIGQNWIGPNWPNQDGQNGIGQSRSLPTLAPSDPSLSFDCENRTLLSRIIMFSCAGNTPRTFFFYFWRSHIIHLVAPLIAPLTAPLNTKEIGALCSDEGAFGERMSSNPRVPFWRAFPAARTAVARRNFFARAPVS